MEIEEAFAEARGLKVLFVGENITDEYVYVSPLYKPSKETILAVAQGSTERFIGGVVAASAHIQGWCDTKILAQFNPVVKRRFVQEGFNHKLFEVYENAHVKSCLDLRRLSKWCRDSDVTIVLDFGHGLIDDRARNVLLGNAKFLAVNAQTNAGNHGFNLVTKYKRADYVCVDYQEARLAVGMQWEPLQHVINELRERMNTDKIIVTQGREGASWPGGGIPALETRPIDTIGAGDCFMAYTAPLIAVGLDLEYTALVGCVAAGIKTEIIGHRRAVAYDEVLRGVVHELCRRDTRITA